MDGHSSALRQSLLLGKDCATKAQTFLQRPPTTGHFCTSIAHQTLQGEGYCPSSSTFSTNFDAAGKRIIVWMFLQGNKLALVKLSSELSFRPLHLHHPLASHRLGGTALQLMQSVCIYNQT